MTPTQQQLLAAVLGDAEVLWALFSGDAPPVAGPWTELRNDPAGWTAERRTLRGSPFCKIAQVAPDEWRAIWCEGRSGPLPTRAEAEAWCDARLREAGVMLVTGADNDDR